MKTHIFLTLILLSVFSSCASHNGGGLSAQQEKDAQARHFSMVGNQADRFR